MKKTYLKSKKGICIVSFTLPKEVGAQNAYLVGEFNRWDKGAAKYDEAFERLLKGLQAESGKP